MTLWGAWDKPRWCVHEANPSCCQRDIISSDPGVVDLWLLVLPINWTNLGLSPEVNNMPVGLKHMKLFLEKAASAVAEIDCCKQHKGPRSYRLKMIVKSITAWGIKKTNKQTKYLFCSHHCAWWWPGTIRYQDICRYRQCQSFGPWYIWDVLELVLLTHYGLVMPYGVGYLGQHWFM